MSNPGAGDERVQQWREADRILDQLLDLAPAVRESALAAMPLATPIADRVRALLRADADADSLLDHGSFARTANPNNSLTGRRFGRWILQQEIGRGGMAVVYRGESATDGTVQLAAVKLLSIAALGAGGFERFRQEQAILARLNHPHIASLYEAGTAADGTPWLAMALVDGIRIDDWCRQQALDLSGRMRLFLDVCRAVAYAHANLVIHRDLKPSNVLVDREAHVRLLDFGIARQSDALSEAPTLTQWRALSPHYAAPEQFSGAPAATSMDVYGLGALLYHLLVGRPPRSDASDLHELPTAPSRAHTKPLLGPVLADAGARHLLRGDIDAIVLKCLAPEPQQRYASVGELIDDIERWQDHRVVRARAPTAGYRMGRFLARHRRAAIAASALILAIFAGAGAALWQAQRAERQAALAEVQRLRAEQSLSFVESLLLNEDRTRPRGTLPDTATLLERGARSTAAAFDEDPEGEARMLALIGRVLARTERFESAIPMLERAYVLRQHHLPAGDPRIVDAALALTAAEVAQLPKVGEAQRQRLGSLLEQSNPRLPDSDRARLLAALANLSDHAGDTETALADFDRAVQLLRGSANARPEALADVLAGRGSLLAKLRRTDPGLRDLREVLELRIRAHGEAHWDTVEALRTLGIAQVHANQPEAGSTLQRALELADSIAPEPNLTSADIAGWLAARQSSHGGRPDLAIPIFQRVVAIRSELLGAAHPETLRARGDLGTVARAAGQYALAEQELSAVVSAMQTAGQLRTVNYGILQRTLAALYLDQGKSRRALTAIQRAKRVLAELAPSIEAYAVPPIAGQLRLLDGEINAACVEFERGAKSSVGLPPADQNRLGIEQAAADCWRRQGKLEQARVQLEDLALRAKDGLAAGHPRIGAIALARGWLAQASGDRDTARRRLKEARDILDPWPGTPAWQRREIMDLRRLIDSR